MNFILSKSFSSSTNNQQFIYNLISMPISLICKWGEIKKITIFKSKKIILTYILPYVYIFCIEKAVINSTFKY